jgi:hypothetical protein
MPDFMLCNSKLTFQLTMTPEKTNFMTQGADGQKRLKQGPDLASYRGLSVIHSRAFSLETGQEARDILRRRVRTAEYYRIPPHKDNHKREFELYSESRDTWFSMTFQDLEAFAKYDEQNEEIHALTLAGPVPDWGMTTLGALADVDIQSVNAKTRVFAAQMKTPLHFLFSSGGETDRTLFSSTSSSGVTLEWTLRAFPSLLGVSLRKPLLFPVYTNVIQTLEKALQISSDAAAACILPSTWTNVLGSNAFLAHALMSPFSVVPEELAARRAMWYPACAFYIEVMRRGGVPMSIVDFDTADFKAVVLGETGDNSQATLVSYLMSLERNPACTANVSDFYLAPRGVRSVNHELHFFNDGVKNRVLELAVCKDLLGGIIARSLIITGETLAVLGWALPDSPQGVVADKFSGLPWSSMTTTAQDFFKAILRWFIEAPGEDRLTATVANKDNLMSLFQNLDTVFHQPVDLASNCTQLLLTGEYSTFPMGITSRTHLLHPAFHMDDTVRAGLLASVRDDGVLNPTCGLLNFDFLVVLADLLKANDLSSEMAHPFTSKWCVKRLTGNVVDVSDDAAYERHWDAFTACLSERFTGDGIENRSNILEGVYLKDRAGTVIPNCDDGCKACTLMSEPSADFWEYLNQPTTTAAVMVKSAFQLDLRKLVSSTDQDPTYNGKYHEPHRVNTATLSAADEFEAANTEFVIIRPNIEHNMLGIILGLAGSDLGHTFWGQTELSCYDDSMHGIWGMSYKYHERAIVFNEKNLVRLWDIAYDGYNGGKDDTHVDWFDPMAHNGYKKFGEATMDLGSSYRGPSMMVMKFTHTVEDRRASGSGFQRNWPSPIVFHEPETDDDGGRRGASLSVDQENLHVVDVEEFRVFHKPLYKKQYNIYHRMMPPFQDNHRTRKSAGEASAESETQSTCLAFQGSMRVKECGKLIQEIQGSGHHGPDYVGVASVRAGKGIKYNGQAPTFSHMV